MKAMLSTLILVIFTSCSMNSEKKQNVTLKDVTDSTYKVGQVWNYNTRPSERNSTFTIVKIEQSSDDTIVHILVDRVKVRTNKAGTKFSETIGHAPFSKAALNASITTLDRTVTALPDFKGGYQEWRKSFLAGHAGVFSIPVSESVEYTEKTMLQGNDVD